MWWRFATNGNTCNVCKSFFGWWCNLHFGPNNYQLYAPNKRQDFSHFLDFVIEVNDYMNKAKGIQKIEFYTGTLEEN